MQRDGGSELHLGAPTKDSLRGIREPRFRSPTRLPAALGASEGPPRRPAPEALSVKADLLLIEDDQNPNALVQGAVQLVVQDHLAELSLDISQGDAEGALKRRPMTISEDLLKIDLQHGLASLVEMHSARLLSNW